MVPDDLPFLYQITMGRCLVKSNGTVKNSGKCKRCIDSGSYTIVDDVKKRGMFDLCQFCTSTQVVLYERYQIVKQVGEGNFSIVYLAQDLFAPTSSVVALKIFHQQYEQVGLAEAECLKDAGASDRNGAFGSLKCFHAFRHNRKHIVIVTESLMTTDLFERPTTPGTAQINSAVGGKCPQYICQLIYNLALNLYLFHENLQRIHGDIKPENVLLSRTDRRFKLIDYGSSVPFDSLKHYEKDYEIVSWLYRAPELLVGVPFGAGVDIWALGSVIFEACAKRPISASLDRAERLLELSDLLGPFPDPFLSRKLATACDFTTMASFDEQDPAWWRRWRAANLLPYLGCKDFQFADLISGMLDPDLNTRLDIQEVLGHPFLASFLPFKPTARTVNTVQSVDSENLGPLNGTAVRQGKILVEEEIETVMLTLTPVKAPAKRGLGTTRKAPLPTGKRKTRSA